jgi:Sec-independent protein translocase protein TatA
MDFSFSEILLICLIAFLVLGPEEFIKKSQEIGRMVGRLKTQAKNFSVMAQEEITKKSQEEIKEKISDE